MSVPITLAAVLFAALFLPAPAWAGDLAMPDEPPAPPVLGVPGRSPGTLLLPGDGRTESVDCTGRNVLIEGSLGRYTLRGGCRSVTVQGHDDTVRAELQPRSRIAIGGDGVTLRYRLTRAGPPPVISITGNASQALNAGSATAIGRPAQQRHVAPPPPVP